MRKTALHLAFVSNGVISVINCPITLAVAVIVLSFVTSAVFGSVDALAFFVSTEELSLVDSCGFLKGAWIKR